MRRLSPPVNQLVVLLVIASSLWTAAMLHAQKKGAPSSVFAQDKGRFTIQLDGKSIGHEDFELSASDSGWIARGTTDLKPPGAASAQVTGTLALEANGVPVSYEWTSKADKTNGARVTFANGVARMTLEMQGATPFQQDLTFTSSLVAILDNNLYDQYGVLARVYDWSKRGAQSFPVFIPQELTPGTISVEATGPAKAEGKTYEGLRVSTSDLEVLLYLDNAHRLMRLEVPSAKVSVVRN
jgi:hypothetical protein